MVLAALLFCTKIRSFSIVGNKGDSCIVAVSRDDGHTVWKVPQENKTLSYSTPLIHQMAGRTQMIFCGNKSVASYNPDDGSVRWIVDGPSEEFVASPAYSERAGFVLSAVVFPIVFLIAIKPDGSGNVTQTHVAWRTTQGVPYVPSPIVVGDYLLTANNISNQASCHEAATGKILWQEKLGRHHASPVCGWTGWCTSSAMTA